jgi:DnaK suppressor protein
LICIKIDTDERRMMDISTHKESLMNEQEMKSYAQQLKQRHVALLSQLNEQREGMAGRVEVAEAHFAHPEDSHAQVISEKDIEFAINDHETAERMAVEAALARIASGIYGQCIDCGEAISATRLQASPEAARCIRCQEAAELESTAFNHIHQELA